MSSGDFDGAGQVPGIEIWRIEKLRAVRTPKESYGQFFTGDSYILLFTKEEQGKRSYSFNLHFWLGAESSQDEIGTAAYKAVELDDSLGGKPVQYRETQEHESELFLSYFKPAGIRYLDGGMESGFKHVDLDAFDPRLLHLKGRRNVRVKQVELSSASLNHGDVFILDAGKVIYQWNGSGANKYEKAKGLDVLTRIKNEDRKGKAQIVILDDGESDGSESPFWTHLGGKGPIKAAEEGGDDAAAEKSVVNKLFIVEDGTPNEISQNPTQDLLNTEACYVLDADTEVFVWVGKTAPKDQRAAAMKIAQDFVTSQGKPAWTPISRISQGGETPMFKSKFASWRDPEESMPRDFSKVKGGSVAKAAEDKGVDIEKMASGELGRRDKEVSFDDGTGKVEVWRIEKREKAPIPESQYGVFYSGDSYIVQYKYRKGRAEEVVIYFWQGRDSSSDEKGASALLTMAMDDAMGGAAVQVRVVEGKEPAHFLTVFKGKFLVLKGGTPSGFNNVKEEESGFSTEKVALFHVKSSSANSVRAVEVIPVAASLNSGDVFILQTPEHLLVWNGSGSSPEEKEVGLSVANRLNMTKESRPVDVVAEGEEPELFWEALGGKGEYSTTNADVERTHEPRLFQCSNVTGAFKVEEIYNFTQDDLVDDDVFILDCYDEVYVWVGHGSNEQEKRQSIEIAQQYVRSAKDGRSPDTPILRLSSGSEPVLFTRHFHGWSQKPSGFVDPYQEKLKKLQASKASAEEKAPEPVPTAAAATAPVADANAVVPYEKLKTTSGVPLPAGLDPSKREQYLSDDEFVKVMGMDKAAFKAMPGWKQLNKKKEAKLF